MLKILIADDHAVVRKGLKQILSETQDMYVVDEAENGNEVLSKIQKRHYDGALRDSYDLPLRLALRGLSL